MENDKGFSDMKDKEETKSWHSMSETTLIHECYHHPEHDCLDENDYRAKRLFVNVDTGELCIAGEYADAALYCPWCGRHAEEIALEFVDEEDLEVAESGS